MKTPSVLIVEDNDEFFEILEAMMFNMLSRKRQHLPLYSIRRARTLNQARSFLTADLDLAVFDACIDGDHHTPDSMEVVEEFKKIRPELPIIGMSASYECLELLAQAGCSSTHIKIDLPKLTVDIVNQLFREAV